MKTTLMSFWARGERGRKWVRYFEVKATVSVAMAPESMTRKSVQPKRKEIRDPYDSRR